MSASKTLFSNYQSNKGIYITSLIFATIYGLISFVNHYNFRTYSLDLGVYTNALYDYIHFQWNDSTSFKPAAENLLADHFDIYLILFSPLSLIFKSYTLLIVQWIAIIFGGIGIYNFFRHKVDSKRYAILASIHFYSFFGIYSSLNFDYHSNVVAAMLVPWLFLSLSKRKYIHSWIWLVLILIAKENMSLWMIFLCSGLGFIYRKDKTTRNQLLLMTLFSSVYFIAIVQYVMPNISNGEAYPHFHYTSIGNNPLDALLFIIQHPIETAKLFFTNRNNLPYGDYVKLETFSFLLLSGLLILFKRPVFIFMLLPIFAQKMLHDNVTFWGFDAQYNIEFTPILTIGVFLILLELKSIKVRNVLAFTCVFLSIIITVRSMDNTVIWSDKTRVRFYQKKHYTKNYDVAKVHDALNTIPKNAIVSAQSPYVPHLALRNTIYEFPKLNNAEYIIFNLTEEASSLPRNEFLDITSLILMDPNWEKVIKIDQFYILKRTKTESNQ